MDVLQQPLISEGVLANYGHNQFLSVLRQIIHFPCHDQIHSVSYDLIDAQNPTSLRLSLLLRRFKLARPSPLVRRQTLCELRDFGWTLVDSSQSKARAYLDSADRSTMCHPEGMNSTNIQFPAFIEHQHSLRRRRTRCKESSRVLWPGAVALSISSRASPPSRVFLRCDKASLALVGT